MSKRNIFQYILFLLCLTQLTCFQKANESRILQNENILSFQVNPKSDQINFYWKDAKGEILGSIANLKTEVESKNRELIFAMNGGMYDKAQNPQGLYIENGMVKSEMDRDTAGYGNFYLMPNGVLIINKDKSAEIKNSSEILSYSNIKFATQSGPMLVHKGMINSKLTKGSKNLHIRNGVGLLPNGNLLFAMSKSEINFYDFASHFFNNGCENALYLDGFVSRTYLPQLDWEQLDGNFGVMIGTVK